MPVRVKLKFDRSMDKVQFYRIYRSDIAGNPLKAKLIAEVLNPPYLNVVNTSFEIVTRITAYKYKLPHTKILDNNEFALFINGAGAMLTYQVDFVNGYLYFDQPMGEENVITAAYQFDGIEFIDSPIEQTYVSKYYGPPADLDGPNPKYYYYIEARNTNDDRSLMSDEIVVAVTT